MTDLSDSLAVSSSGMRAQSTRLRLLAENISNADTPGYRRKAVPFEAVHNAEASGMIKAGRTTLDQSELREIFDPAHPLADEAGMYNGSNVNILIEMADAREAQRGYEANLKMFDQARQMSSKLMELLRR